MLRSLSIRNMVLIEALDLDFAPGLNVLTGETGAGKSILLDCLGFVLGRRGRGDLVRAGAVQGEVIAEFDLALGHPARDILTEAGIDAEEEMLLLRRVSTAEGRKTAYVNDRKASAGLLAALAETLVEVHGQHDDRGLLDPSGHRALLDAFAGHGDLLETMREAAGAETAAAAALAAARTGLEAAARDEEYLRHAVEELAKLDPQPGEDAELDTSRRRMQAAERIRADIARAQSALGTDGAERPIADALRWLEDAAEHLPGQLDAPIAALTRTFAELAEAQSGVDTLLNMLDVDPLELERTEERLFALRALARKHDVLPDALAELAEELTARLAAIDGGAEAISGLEAALAEATRDATAAAEALTASRRAAAARLDAAVMEELSPLRMDAARFETLLETVEPGPGGQDRITFTVATNPGAPAGPINRIASGGELSRFLLALKVCLSARSEGLTMIFDEIDRGVGGATADAVGRRLHALADRAQVLVVTHSPQVAARGASHWRIAKSSDGTTTRTDVTALGPADREAEIGRMLAGESLTDEALAAARALLAG
ncbi:MAG: DNA repair protein RecN [Pseudomonadota bacterium]